MTRITIDISDSGTTISQPASAQPIAPIGGTTASGAPADLLARASALGAINGGPAPSLDTSLSGPMPAPVPASDMQAQSGVVSASAGAAPESLFKSDKS